MSDSAPHRIRALVVDDHELVWAGLRAVGKRRSRIEIIGDAATRAQAIAQARVQPPDSGAA
jgi:DNA-binding NarL/FixJ family response regulator